MNVPSALGKNNQHQNSQEFVNCKNIANDFFMIFFFAKEFSHFRPVQRQKKKKNKQQKNKKNVNWKKKSIPKMVSQKKFWELREKKKFSNIFCYFEHVPRFQGKIYHNQMNR